MTGHGGTALGETGLERAATTSVAGETLALLPSGAAWWAATRTLIVADLHFEKGSSQARRGFLLPPHDTIATLARLTLDVAATEPARIVSLGDAFHDASGPERMEAGARAALAALQAGRDWLWIDGNHDADVSAEIGGRRAAEAAIGALIFRHEPKPRPESEILGEVAGHLHPAARVRVEGGTVRRHCFVGDGRRMILPAYGAFAGGLDVASRAFAGLFDTERLGVHLLGEGRVHAFPGRVVVGVGLSRGGTSRPRASR